jgi:signal transduction histidine kinase
LLGLSRAATTSRLWSGAVHEVNNALQVISGTLELLETRKDLPTAVVQALERVAAQSRRAAAAMAEVQVFTKASRGQRSPVNIKEIASHSLALRQFAIRRAGLASRLDAETGPFLVLGNRGDLQQALLCVLIIAEQAMHGTNGTIDVKVSGTSELVSITVADAGPGFAISPVDRAFAPFVSGRDAFESAGLGLWAAQVIVRDHGGTIDVASSPAGTSVTMQLPASPVQLPASPIRPPVRD